MNIVIKLIIVGLSCYAAGTIAGPIAVGAVDEAKQSFSPFLLISLAILIASIGYVIGCIRRSPFRPEFPERERYYQQ